MTSFPKTLFLTFGAPDARYRIIRAAADKLPPDRLFWCSLQPAKPNSSFPFSHVAVAPKRLHWRLGNTTLDYLYTNEIQARAMARKMCAATKAFEPEVLWVLAELGTVSVGYHLHNMMGLPIHATVYDAHETARWHLPSLYYPWYIRSVDRFFSELASFDAISEEMAQYLKTRYPNLTNVDEAICQPFVVSGYCASSPSSPWELNDCTKRIAFCGTNRMNSEQWQAFLDALGKLPNKFEIVAFAYKDSFPQAGVFPSNVSATFLPFMDSEAQIIEKFLSLRVHAGYLGLWKDPKRLLFGNTSLSAKLTTYAAAGCPVIVDATESSVAWRLVKKYHAGVLFNGQTDDLKLLFENREEWLRMANGSIEMCRNEFNVDKNVAPLRKMLEKISKIKVSKTNPS